MEFVRLNSFRRPQKLENLPPASSTSSIKPALDYPQHNSTTSSSNYASPLQLHKVLSSTPGAHAGHEVDLPDTSVSVDHMDASDQTIRMSDYPASSEPGVESIQRIGFMVADGDTTSTISNNGLGCRHPDFVVLVPTPRTSSPIPKSSGQEKTPAMEESAVDCGKAVVPPKKAIGGAVRGPQENGQKSQKHAWMMPNGKDKLPGKRLEGSDRT